MKKIFVTAALLFCSLPAFAAPLRIVALGDSLTAGYGLQATESYPAQLQAALQKEKLDVVVQNAGISGDTTAGGVARLAKAIAGEPKPALVIVALGANDMLRGVKPQTTEQNLRTILQTLKTQNIPAMLFGMRVPYQVTMGYGLNYGDLYEDLADEFDVPFYPFFLEGVAHNPRLNLGDGVHPNAQGIAVMVKNTTPLIVDLLED